MKIINKHFFIYFILINLFTSSLFCAQYKVTTKNYNIIVNYDKKAFPGNAFFVQLKVSDKNDITKEVQNVNANSFLTKNNSKDEIITNCQFFKTNSQNEYLAILPMWTTEKANENAQIIIKYSINNLDFENIKLNVVIEQKEYPTEEIELNSELTNLVSKPNEEKKQQTKELNDLLKSKDDSNIYELDCFTRPVSSKRITSEFGQSRTFVYNDGKRSPSYHAGLDFGIPTGTKVYACGKGKVVMARWRIVTGYSVIIEHLPGLYSIYYHLDKLNCKVGDVVTKDDVIAFSGSTGLATGPHLHWEVRLNYVPLDPDFFTNSFIKY